MLWILTDAEYLMLEDVVNGCGGVCSFKQCHSALTRPGVVAAWSRSGPTGRSVMIVMKDGDRSSVTTGDKLVSIRQNTRPTASPSLVLVIKAEWESERS